MPAPKAAITLTGVLLLVSLLAILLKITVLTFVPWLVVLVPLACWVVTFVVRVVAQSNNTP